MKPQVTMFVASILISGGYQNYVTWLEKKGTVSDIRENELSPGDLAIT